MSRLMRWVYRDMLEAYYDTEKPLPLDVEDVCDLVGAYEVADREAVKRVLKIKFDLRDDGHHHIRCDETIAAYQASIEDDSARKENEAERQRRSRERRKELFKQLRDEFDVVTAYDTPMKELESLLASHRASCDKTTSHATVTRDIEVRPSDATAITNNQEPITNNHKPVKNKDKSPPAPDPLFPDVDSQIVADFKALRTKHKAPITRTAMQGIVREAEKAGLTLEGALRICCERGWRGFKAEWITQHAVRAGPGQVAGTVYDQTMAAAERAKARIFGNAAPQGETHDAG